MADVTSPVPGQKGDDGRDPRQLTPSAGGKAATGAAADLAGGERSADPRAVRVAVSGSSRLGEEPAIVVSPPRVPLAPIRHSLAGTGPLGGTAHHENTPAARGSMEGPVTTAGPSDGPAVLVDGELVAVRLVRRGRQRAILVLGEGSETERRRIVFTGGVIAGTDGLARREVVVDGWRIEVELEPERRAALRERARAGRQATGHGGPTEVHAIIPGRVVAVSVTPGDAVTAGQQILVVEAMKMQNELRAPRDGTIRKVAVAPGVTIEVGDLLLVIE